MPVTILDSDLAVARLPGGRERLVLHYTGEAIPPAFFLLRRGGDGRELAREGPFDDEYRALAAAAERHGALDWSAR